MGAYLKHNIPEAHHGASEFQFMSQRVSVTIPLLSKSVAHQEIETDASNVLPNRIGLEWIGELAQKEIEDLAQDTFRPDRNENTVHRLCESAHRCR